MRKSALLQVKEFALTKTLAVRVMLLGALLLLPVGIPEAQAVPVLNPANGHYYEAIVNGSDLSWTAANAVAEAATYQGVQGHLVSITSQAENDFIFENFLESGTMEYWIGGYQDSSAPDYSEPDGGFR